MDSTATRWTAVGTDGSEPSLVAVDWAAAEAAERGTALRICHVVADARSADGAAVLARATERARRTAPGLLVQEVSRSGEPAAELIAAAGDAEALVLGPRGAGGMAARILGSVSEQVAMHAHCPVVVVRQPRRAGPITVGVDMSPEARAATGFAFARAAELRLAVRAVHAYTLSVAAPSESFLTDGGPQRAVELANESLDQVLADWTGRYPGVTVIRRVVDDVASAVLVDESRSSGLLVVGSRGRGRFTRLLLGSVSRYVLRHAECAVAVVRR